MEKLKRILAAHETITAVASNGEVHAISSADELSLQKIESAERILIGGRLYSRAEVEKLLR